MKAEEIAKVAYSVNAAYCEAIGDHPPLPWEDVREGMTTAVLEHLVNPKTTPAESHERWMAAKLREGWTYGPQKDAAAKTHPCMRPYHELPVAQRAKDFLFGAVVVSLRD
jgi:hypothetical protein